VTLLAAKRRIQERRTNIMNPRMKLFTKSLLLSLALALCGRGALQATTTFTVTNTLANGSGSLIDAITNANNTPGLDTIAFNIPSSDAGCHNVAGVGTVCTIQPGNMPAITDPVTIDGYTQPGSSQNTLSVGDNAKILIEIDGTGAISSGMYVIVDSVTIRGLVINRFSDQSIIPDRGNGVFVASTGTVVEGCFIGTDPTGTIALPNGKDGVSFHGLGAGLGARVGGASPAQRNILSGNNGNGILIVQQAGGVQVLGNYLGTDRNGTSAVPNVNGIAIDGNGSLNNNQIGGSNAGEGNVISGNFYPDPTSGGYGITIGGGDCHDFVQGNYIGLGADGITPLGNNSSGVNLTFRSNNLPANTIGGANPGEGNVVSSNGGNGISSSFSTGDTIQGNLIGTAADGTTPRGNALNGVNVLSFGNTVGGTTTGAGNVIAFNGKNGVSVPFAFVFPSSSNAILANSIHDNGTTTSDLGIDLDDGGGGDGVSPNDPCDGDGGGANELQNYPVLTAASVSGGVTTIQGTLDSVSNTTYRIEFFANTACDVSGYGEGERYLGSVDVISDSNCSATINAAVAATTPGEMITATATDPANNSSEFSACLEVQNGGGSPLTLIGAASRKTHGSAGNFDLPLVLDPASDATVEPRSGGPTQVIFTFSDDVFASDGMISANEFTITNATFSSASISGNEITLNLSGVVDQSIVTIALSGLENASGDSLSGDNDLAIRALLGDVNQNRVVDRPDTMLLRAHMNEPVNGSNFVFDLDLNGTVGPHDGRIVRMNKRHAVP
jgi:hypothetical protein